MNDEWGKHIIIIITKPIATNTSPKRQRGFLFSPAHGVRIS
jgi:hypothetical protein